MLPLHVLHARPLGLTLSALAFAAIAAAQGQYPNYYPSRPGTHWTYSSGETQVVGNPVTHKGVRVTPVSHQYGSTTYSQDLLEYRPDGSVWLRGIWLKGGGSGSSGKLTWYNPPLNVYPPAPLTPGMTWASSTAGLKTTSTVTGLAAVKAGTSTYNALTISTLTNAGGKMSTQVTYFVPSVGVVRYETADGSQINLMQ